jgi:catechol 2,3-dioxygenase-like lactoylglutathione lyase family enzyme
MIAEVGPRVVRTQRIVRISRVVSDIGVAASFYCERLEFRVTGQRRAEASVLAALGISGGAEEAVLVLGDEEIALVQFDTPGHGYPPDSHSNDLWFQHLAIVVSDMDAAYAKLCAKPGLTWISVGGPQVLPPANGSVRAFKFRDPDSHPLELIWFPKGQGRDVWDSRPGDGLFKGIDHSGISVADTERSRQFYQGLGFSLRESSLNEGEAQCALDDLRDACVSVTGLRPASPSGPGIELLQYRQPGRPAGSTSPRDIITDWVTLDSADGRSTDLCEMRDPDSHRLLISFQDAR